MTPWVIVSDCVFLGCRFGVWGTGEGCFVEHCRYTQAYAYSDTLETIRRWRDSDVPQRHHFWFWARKGHSREGDNVPHYETGIAGGSGTRWHIRNNWIDECFEGLSCWCVDTSRHWRIYGNRFERIVDNAVESENHAVDMRVHHNIMTDVFEPFSYQPLGGVPWPGPIFVYHNRVDYTEEFQLLAAGLLHRGFRPGVFKLGVSNSNWRRSGMGGAPADSLAARQTKRAVYVADPGFLAFNNTLIAPWSNAFSMPQPTSGKFARALVNFRFFNNIFQVQGVLNDRQWNGELLEFYRNVELIPGELYHRAGFLAGDEGEVVASADAIAIEGLLTMREPDASAIPGAKRFELQSGPRHEVPARSEFARQIEYDPFLLFTPGPEYGWGVYTLDRPKDFTVGPPEGRSTLQLVFRVTETDLPSLLAFAGVFRVSAERDKHGMMRLTVSDGARNQTFELGEGSRDEWQTVDLSFTELLALTHNGQTQTGSMPGVPPAGAVWKCRVGRNPVYDVRWR